MAMRSDGHPSYDQSILLLNPKNYSPQNDAFLSFHYFNPPPTWMRYLTCVMCVFVIVFGGIGNLTTLAAFARNYYDKRRHSQAVWNLWQRQYVNIAALALADAFICLYSTTVVLIENAANRWIFPAWFCRMHWAITAWSFFGGMRLLMLVGYDRYLIVKLGVNYERVETWRKIAIRTLFFGLIDPALGTIPLQYLNYLTGVSVTSDDGPAARNEPYMCFPENMQLGYIYPGVYFLAFIYPVLTMAYFYWKVYRYTQQHTKNSEAERTASKKSRSTIVVSTMTVNVDVPNSKKIKSYNTVLSRHQRATRILKFLFASLAIFYAPFAVVTVVLLLIMSGVTPNLDLEWWTYLLAVTQIIGVINTALNPLLYAYTMPKLHETMVCVWKDSAQWMLGRFGRSTSASGGGRNCTQTNATDISVKHLGKTY